MDQVDHIIQAQKICQELQQWLSDSDCAAVARLEWSQDRLTIHIGPLTVWDSVADTVDNLTTQECIKQYKQHIQNLVKPLLSHHTTRQENRPLYAIGTSGFTRFTHGPYKTLNEALTVVPTHPNVSIIQLNSNGPNTALYKWNKSCWERI